MRDYNHYKYSPEELVRLFIVSLVIIGLVSYLFYDSPVFMALLVPFYPIFLKIRAQGLLQKQKNELCSQFKETISAVAAALNAGYSVENAWKEAYSEVVQMFGEKSLMANDLRQMLARLSMNVPLEELLDDFARRSGIEDVASFCDVFFFAKRSGGDFIGIIRSTADRIGRKVALQRQLETDLAARRLESRIMNVVPLGILLYLKLTSPGYFDMLYGNLPGICIMSACLAVYLFAYAMAEGMMRKGLAI